MVKPQSEGNNTVDADGNPLWRMAPSPHGPYWEKGQKVGYQDVGSWTFLKSTPSERAQAAWRIGVTESPAAAMPRNHALGSAEPRPASSELVQKLLHLGFRLGRGVRLGRGLVAERHSLKLRPRGGTR